MERKIKIVDGELVSFRYVPTEAERQQRHFAKELERQSDWMPETSMKKIIEAYNEAFNKYFN